MIDYQDILRRAEDYFSQIQAWRRYLHQHPELSFQEHETAAYVDQQLRAMQIPTQTEVARTGVVGVVNDAHPGPMIALRADMDALPITEANGTGFDSRNRGIMHACGHDVHTAMLLGAAAILRDLTRAKALPGRVKLLFQPSEEMWDAEGNSGATLMVAEGVLDDVQAVFGQHVDPTLDVGTVATRVGPMMANSDAFTLTIIGQSAHAARPHQGLDAIALAATVVQAIQQIVSRRLNPIDEGVITIGTIEGGTKLNIIAGHVKMTGTIRSFTPGVRQQLYHELAKAAEIARTLGGDYQLDIEEGHDAVVNDPAATGVMVAAAKGLLGADKVSEIPKMMAGEDFAVMAATKPACFLRLGVHNPNWSQRYFVHTPTFRIDPHALTIGTAALVSATLTWFEQFAIDN